MADLAITILKPARPDLKEKRVKACVRCHNKKIRCDSGTTAPAPNHDLVLTKFKNLESLGKVVKYVRPAFLSRRTFPDKGLTYMVIQNCTKAGQACR